MIEHVRQYIPKCNKVYSLTGLHVWVFNIVLIIKELSLSLDNKLRLQYEDLLRSALALLTFLESNESVLIADHRRLWLRSFGVMRISNPRSVWIMVHQRNRWIHGQNGFASSFDAPWSRQILDQWSGSLQRNAAYIVQCCCYDMLQNILLHLSVTTRAVIG